jgi:hypothetical protein
MKTVTQLSLALTLALAAALPGKAQTSIEARTIPSADGQAQQSVPMPHIPTPEAVNAQPSAVLPPNQDEIRRRVAAAVEEVLALYGNPPFAEVITNDQPKAAALRAQLAMIGQVEALRAEVASLTARKEALQLEVEAKEKELAYFRDQAAKLRQAIDVTVERLTQVPSVLEQQGASSK